MLNLIRQSLPILVILYLVGQPASAEEPSDRWIDLTHDLSGATVFWPTAKPFRLTVDAEGMTDLGYYYSAYSFCTAEHGGTHIDAPVHFAKGRQSVDQIELWRLIGDAAVVDVSAQAAENRDYQVSVADLQRWEQVHGTLAAGTIVLLRTGFADYWPNAKDYLGTELRGPMGASALRFPGLHPTAAQWLATEREIASIGIDTASIDHGQSRLFRSHVVLMQANIPAFENVANLEQLPAVGAFVVALPTKIKGGSGGPLRIVARVPGD